MSDDSHAVDAPPITVGSVPARTRLRWLALLFLMCWIAELAVSMSVDEEGFGLLSIAGAFGAAVFPWLAGATAMLLSGRAGRWIGPVASIVAFGVLALVEHL